MFVARIAAIDIRGNDSLKLTGRFFRLLVSRSALFLFLFSLITAGALALHIFPIEEIILGLIALADSNALSSVVSFAQWIIADDIIKYTFIFIFAAPAPLALICSFLFTGAFGSFAKGMEKHCDFPANSRTGFWGGYHSRFMHVTALFFIELIILLLFVFVWTISAIPLAIINELVNRGTLQSFIFNALLAVTLLAAYAGMLFLRIYPMSFIPALFSGAHKPITSAFSFASRYFFRVARCFLIADAVLLLQSALYNYFNKAIHMLVVNCFISSIMIFFLFFIMFETYAEGGYGYDEYDEYNEYDDADNYGMPGPVNGARQFERSSNIYGNAGETVSRFSESGFREFNRDG